MGVRMLDFQQVKTLPIAERVNKFSLRDMIALDSPATFSDPCLTAVADAVIRAVGEGRPVIFMMGGAVIKEGCSDLICDLLRRGVITHLAGNGSVSIHDFELALIGETSEDVADGLETGSFGMAEETGRIINETLRKASKVAAVGYGEAIGSEIERLSLPHRERSLLATAVRVGARVTIHVSIGGDIIHQHPACDGAALGATSFHDFRLLAETTSELSGGVVLNVGSAVNLPEVFLKALTIARNLGHDAGNFTTANFDFLDMYRPRTRIVEWPKVIGCRGFDVRGGHRDTIPALHRALSAI